MTQRTEPWAGYSAGLPAPPPTPPRGTPRRGTRAVLLAALLAALVLIGTLVGMNDGSRTANPLTSGTTTTGDTSTAGLVGSVVDIDTAAQLLGADGLRPLGAGSGMILTGDGEILTNNHVVEGASSIQVTVPGHGIETASVVGVDPTDDVALLHLSGVSGLSPVTIGDSSSVQVGDAVTAIGNAFGRGGPPTATSGTVTALHRTITATDPSGTGSERLSDVIQVDAGVHPGDSGGALVNAEGQVIGIITAGPSNSTTGVGFAIPINAALGIVNEIRAGRGSSTILMGERGFIGVAVRPVDAATAAQLGLSDGTGVLVAGVQPGSPAEGAGIAAPSVILTIDGQSVNSLDELGTAIHSKTPGEQIQVSWVDRQGDHTAALTLSTGPAV
jgi:S1-C subfamily serine protease